jgi:UDPglucose 6-dehydrogenase/GDP-mannose 6-dehydrogenase
MRVSVIGAGYVGLVSGVCLAELGHQVACVDVDASRVAKIRSGEPPLFEEGLEELLRRNLGRQFTATEDLRQAVRGSDVTLIAVGTPFDGARIDLTHVREAAHAVGAALRDRDGYHVVAIKSTVIPGTTDTVVRAALEEGSGKTAGPDFGLGMNPEFLTEGQAIRDFMQPDRIVLGAADARALGVLDTLYASFWTTPKIRTTLRTAEMIKYASNALLATAISFANEIANLCAAVGGVDALEVMEGVHASSYLTVVAPDGTRLRAPLASFLLAGCGFGGSCLPKDVKALVAQGETLGLPMPLLRAVLEVNAGRPGEVVQILERELGPLAGRRVGVLGLAFKPDTDDVRESPAIPVIQALLARGARVKAYDPVAIPTARKLLGDAVAYAGSLDECLCDVDAAVLITRWRQFEDVPARVAAMARPPLVLDGRRQLDKHAVPRYAGIGL